MIITYNFLIHLLRVVNFKVSGAFGCVILDNIAANTCITVKNLQVRLHNSSPREVSFLSF